MTVCTAFWAALDARDWSAFGATVTEDVVATWPQSRERLRGRDALVRFMTAYPGDWRLSVEQEHVDAGGGATRVAFTLDGTTQTGLTFFELADDGRIAALTEWWPEPYEPPPGRAHLMERY